MENEVIEKTKAYKQAQIKAEESERLKTSFLNNLSHELKTPMNGILGFIDYLEDPDLEGDMCSQFIENIKTTSDRLLSTLHDLIEISEIEAGSIKTQLGSCNLSEINGVLFDRYQVRCELKGLRLIQEFQIAPRDAKILSDINKIKSIFFHLLNNALKFSESGSIRYGFRREGDQLVGYVTDEGPGIDKKDLKSLTQHFTQLEEHLTRQHDGLGIGLSISKAFAESLNGKIFIESKKGKGSTFSLSIPYLKYEEPEVIEAPTDGKTLADKEALEVIIVDDDLINLQLMRKMLEKRAVKIHEAQNGVEAVKLFELYPNADLILMD